MRTHYDSYDTFRARVAMDTPSPPQLNIYLASERPNCNGVMQRIFDWMRSGEWLSTLEAEEILGVTRHQLNYHIGQLRRRGFVIENQTLKVRFHLTQSKYRLLNWEPR